MDDADRRLLRLVQEDARRPLQSLADAAGMSVASVQRRLKRLRDEGVILREVALLDPVAMGHVTAVVTVEMERDRIDLIDGFRRAADRFPAIQQLYTVSGEIDFVLVVVVPDMAAYDAFMRDFLYANRNVKKFRTMIAYGRDKFSSAVPV